MQGMSYQTRVPESGDIIDLQKNAGAGAAVVVIVSAGLDVYAIGTDGNYRKVHAGDYTIRDHVPDEGAGTEISTLRRHHADWTEDSESDLEFLDQDAVRAGTLAGVLDTAHRALADASRKAGSLHHAELVTDFDQDRFREHAAAARREIMDMQALLRLFLAETGLASRKLSAGEEP
jgi:hypothetical protein